MARRTQAVAAIGEIALGEIICGDVLDLPETRGPRARQHFFRHEETDERRSVGFRPLRRPLDSGADIRPSR